MSSLIGIVTSIVTAAVGWIGDFAGLFLKSTEGVLDYPILLLPIAIGVAGFGIGALKRLMRID